MNISELDWTRHSAFARLAWPVLLAMACSGRAGDGYHTDDTDPDLTDTAGRSPSTGGNSAGATGGWAVSIGATSPLAGTTGAEGEVCESASRQASLLPVHLAFAFDVSGSMGKIEDSECFDPAFKWKPVVEATTTFFESASTIGLTASMVLFPADDDVCDAESYAAPDIGLQALPSDAFRGLLADYDAEVLDDGWRGNTPTLAAFEGTLSFVQRVLETTDTSRAAIVLVTDGRPQGCDDEIDEPVERALFATDIGIATYVIGVQQPTEKPGCDRNEENLGLLDNLNAIASAGGTTTPFMIDTGDPAATQAALESAIEKIRGNAISCKLNIPSHPEGRQLDKDRTDVSMTGGGSVLTLPYDPDCNDGGGWRYDDPVSPSQIELCAEACASLQGNSAGRLQVDFLCEPRLDVIR